MPKPKLAYQGDKQRRYDGAVLLQRLRLPKERRTVFRVPEFFLGVCVCVCIRTYIYIYILLQRLRLPKERRTVLGVPEFFIKDNDFFF